jgi:1-phosphofructokinase family hexose kinase
VIRVVGANPAFDRIAVWPPVMLGAVNRAARVVPLAGGKGLNVCRAIRELGQPVAAYGFAGGIVGEAIRAGCAAAGIEDRLTQIAGETRVCFIVVEPEAGRATVLNEPGPTASEDEAQRLLDAIAADGGPGDLLVLSGTLPLGLEPAVMARMVAIGREAGCRVILDSSGPTLRAAVRERPWMVKCNAGEFAGLEREADPSGVAPPPADPLALVGSARALVASGIELVVITLGPDGLLAVSGDEVLRVRPPAVRALNPVGSGDVFLAALAVRLEALAAHGAPALAGLPPYPIPAPLDGPALAESLAFASACAAGSVARLLPEVPPPDEIGRLAEGVRWELLAG